MSQKLSRIVGIDVQWRKFSVTFYSILCRVQEEEEKEKEDIYGGSTDDEQEETINKGICLEEMQLHTLGNFYKKFTPKKVCGQTEI